jgi:hypothetical protein
VHLAALIMWGRFVTQSEKERTNMPPNARELARFSLQCSAISDQPDEDASQQKTVLKLIADSLHCESVTCLCAAGY